MSKLNNILDTATSQNEILLCGDFRDRSVFMGVGGGGDGGFLTISENFFMIPLQFSLECPIKPVHLPVKNLFRLQLLGWPPFKLENFRMPPRNQRPPPTHKK